jgi:hypothetical protein
MQPGDPVLQALRAGGDSVLIAGTPQDAMQILRLHAGTVEAAVVHREGDGGVGTPGIEFLSMLRGEAATADLAVILTSEVWDDARFAEHQSTPEGVNAYLSWADAPSQLRPTLDQMLRGDGASLALSESPVALGSPQTLDVESLTRQLQVPGSSSISLIVDPAHVPPPIPMPTQSASLSVAELSRMLVVPTASAPAELSLASLSAVMPSSVSVPTVSASDLAPAVSAAISIHEPASEQKAEVEAEPDQSAEKAMPYLFGTRPSRSSEIMPVVMGDAVVPGGAAQSPDVETLKHYLELREKDVSALAIQLRETRELLKRAQEDLRVSHSLMEDQASKLEVASRRDLEFEREKALLTEGVQAEIEQMRFELKAKNDKIRMLQSKVQAGEQEMERLRERVRSDLRSIKSNEKNLENQLEMLKRDAETRIAMRNSVITELKRKLDLTEFNLDLVQDKLVRERERGEDLRGKLIRASQAVRVAGGLLDPPEPAVDSDGDSAGVDHDASNRKVS